jgi:hypothetical protein
MNTSFLNISTFASQLICGEVVFVMAAVACLTHRPHWMGKFHFRGQRIQSVCMREDQNRMLDHLDLSIFLAFKQAAMQ